MNARHELYFKKALRARGFSDHTDTQSGAVLLSPDEETIIIETNRIPDGVKKLAARLAPGERTFWIEHAERLCINLMARTGVPVAGCTMYSIWLPCMDCARAIVAAGITKLIVSRPLHEFTKAGSNEKKWEPHFARVESMFKEAEVELEWYDGPSLSIPELD